jgi:hypothetical protein
MEIIDELKLREMEKSLEKEARAYQGMGIKLLAIAGGLLGSLFTAGFIYLFFKDSSIASIIVGLTALVVSVYFDKKYESIVFDTACIGGYLAACAMIGYGIDKAYGSDNLTTSAMLAIGIMVLWLSTSYMLNFFSVLFVSAALFAFININKIYDLVHVLVAIIALTFTLASLYEAKLLASRPRINIVYNSWRNALLFAFLALLAFIALDNVTGKYIRYEWISSLVIIGIHIFLISKLIEYLQIEKNHIPKIYLLSLLVMLLAIYSPAICGAMLVLLISFHAGHKPGMVLSIFGLLYFTGQFYYNLHYTLLVKSIIMFSTGVLFLFAWVLFKKALKRHGQI